MSHRLLAAAFSLLLLTVPALAHETKKGPITVDHAWSRPTPPSIRTGVVYMKLVSQSDDRLVSASSPMADKVELHRHEMEGDVAKMRPVPAIDFKAGGPVILEPGGLHIMLIGLKEPLKVGTRFPLSLRFEKAGEVKVIVEVENIRQPAQTHGH